MAAFDCPTCKTRRHIDDGETMREDKCWLCGTLVPYSSEELERYDREMALDDAGGDGRVAHSAP